MGFTKLDEGILQSSIMAEDSDTFKIWITLLAACREDGIAYVSPVYLSSICRIPLDTVLGSIKKLEEPDPLSRSLNVDGRRIRRVDGGYEIINYLTYRGASLRSAAAEQKRLYRRKKRGDCPDSLLKRPDASDSLSVSVSDKLELEFTQFWDAYGFKVSKVDALKAYKALRKKVEEAVIIRAVNGYKDFLEIQRSGGFNQSKMYPATFLRSERWRDYLNFNKPRVGENKRKGKSKEYVRRVLELKKKGLTGKALQTEIDKLIQEGI